MSKKGKAGLWPKRFRFEQFSVPEFSFHVQGKV